MSSRTPNQKAWWLVLPVVLLVAFNAVIPLMAVVNYSVQETFGNNQFFFEGVRWFEDVMQSARFREALQRQMLFTALALAIHVALADEPAHAPGKLLGGPGRQLDLALPRPALDPRDHAGVDRRVPEPLPTWDDQGVDLGRGSERSVRLEHDARFRAEGLPGEGQNRHGIRRLRPIHTVRSR